MLGCGAKGFPIISKYDGITNTPQYVITDYDFEHDIATVEELKDGDDTEFFQTHPGKFKCCFLTYLLKHQKDITYRYWYKDGIKKRFVFGFQKLPSSTDEYEESTDVPLSWIYKNHYFGLLNDPNSTPDLYVSLIDTENRGIAVTNEVREPGDFTYPGCSLIVPQNRSLLGTLGQDFYEGKKWSGYRVETVIKGGRPKSASSLTRICLYVWMTRHGFDLYIGNTKEEAESGLGLFGYTMPHYWYPQLKEGQTIQAKIIAYEVV